MVKGLPLCGVCQPVPEALDGEKTLCVEFLNLENGTEVFMVTGAFHGQQIAVLLDTGAGLTFIAAEVVNRLAKRAFVLYRRIFLTIDDEGLYDEP